MKVSLSKRLLSAFLAMMMIITSVPMMSLTAFAAEDKAEVLFYDFCGGNSATYDDNEKGRVVDVSKHTQSVKEYTPVASSNGYTISFNYNPLNVTDHPIINIGTSGTAGGSRTYFELFENGDFHWTWDIDSVEGNNYFDATGVFGDKLTANAWHDITIVVTPVGGLDIISIYVDNVLTKTIDLTKGTKEEMGVTSVALYSGKCISAYLAEERPVWYGTGAGYWSHTEQNDDGYIDDVVIRNNADATIEMLKAVMTDYESKMAEGGKSGTVYMNMRAAYLAYVEANKVYDAYYYGGNLNNVVSQDDITTAYWHMRLNFGNMWTQEWTPATIESSPMGGFRINNSSTVSGADISAAYSNLLYSGTAVADLASASASNNLNGWLRFPETTMLYDGKTDPIMPVMVCLHKNRGMNNRYVLAIALSTDKGNDLVLAGDGWHGASKSYSDWDYSGAYNDSKQTGNSTAEWQGFLLGGYTNDNSQGFANTMKFAGFFDDGEIVRKTTPTLTAYCHDSNAAVFNNYVMTLKSSSPVNVVNYELIVDTINMNKARLARITNYKQGGADEFLRGFDRLCKNPVGFFEDAVDSTTHAEALATLEANYTNGLADIEATPKAVEPNYAKIRSAMTTPFLNPDTNQNVSPMERYNGRGQGNYTDETWNRFAAAYKAAQQAMVNVVNNDYAPVSADIATELTAAFEALRLPEVKYTEPVFSPESGATIGPDTKISITSDSADAVIKYKVVYDGETQVVPTDLINADVYSGEFAPFAGSSEHSTATVYAAVVEDGQTASNMAIISYYIYMGPNMSVATGSAIAPDAEITLTAAPDMGGNVYEGPIEYRINDGEWISYNEPIVPFAGLNSSEVTVYARQTVDGETSAISSATYVRATSKDLAITSEMGNKVSSTSTITITDPENVDATIKYTMNVNGEEKVTAATYSAPIALSDLGNIEYIIINAWRDYQGEETAVKKIFLSDDLDTLALRESFDNASINGLTFSSTPDFGSNYSGKFTEQAGSVVAGAGNIDGNANGYDWSSGWRENALKINANSSVKQHLEIANPIASREANKVAAQNNGITLSYWRYVERDGKVVDDITQYAGNDYWYTGVGFKAADTNEEYFLANMNGWATFRNNYGNAAGFRYQDIKADPQNKTLHAAGNYSGQWMNIVITVDPNAETNNVMVYTNGEPHESTYAGDFGNSKGLANEIINFITREDTVLTIGDNGMNYWANGFDTYIDDVRVYTDVLSQVDINNMYTDEYSDVWSEKALAHDPTAVTVYTLADGRTVGQEYMDANPGTSYSKIDYYMFGTGLTVYHSDDAYIWKAVGDDKGRCGYQNQQLFGSDYVTALAGPLGWTQASPENKPGAGYLVWAPHVMYNTAINKWCFYGSTSAWGALQSEIFMGTSDNITGPYTNITTIARSVSTENKVNAIDPATFYSPDGTLYMVYGSYQTGIAIKKLNADGTCIGGESKYIADLNASLDDGGAQLITTVEGIGSGEGPFVKYQNGWYYLYVAYGGNGWNYTTRVFRSKNPEGPYAGINGVEANSTLSNDERMRGNQFMSSYLIQGNEWINSGTAHNSIFNAENDKGEIVTLNAVHSRPLATSQTDKMNAVEDGALATRQSDLSGNNTVINMVGYTESGWPVTFPLKYNGTDSLNLGNVTARDLAGIYAGNKFDMGLAWNQYNGLYTFRMVAADDYTGVLYGTEYNGTLFTFDFEIINYDTHTWVRFKNSEGFVVREATVATQVKDGKTVYELGFINCDSTSESYGKQIWCYKGQDLPNPDDVESNAVAVDMDQIIYTHKANEEYYLYGQEISDNLDYDPINRNFGERATKIRVKYPYRIDTSDPGAVYCYSDEQICADYGCTGSGLYAELVKEAKAEGEYSEYILRGYVSDYFKYNADTDSYTEDGVILIISYKDENGKEYSEFAFSYVMPNPAMAHTLQFMRNQNVRTGNDKRISTGLFTRFVGSEGAATNIISSLTKSPHANFTTAPIRDTGTFNYLATFGDAESINDANYDTPALIESQFTKFDKSVGVNAGSFGAAEHDNNQDGWYTNTSAVVQADYYLDYSNPDNPIINRDSNGVPTGYSIRYLATNLQWKPKTNSQYGTSYMNNRTGLTAELSYTSNTDILVDTSLKQMDRYLIGENGRKVMSGSVTDSAYSDANFETGLVPAFTKISGTQATTNTWTGQIVLTGKESVEKMPLVDSSDADAAEKSSNFIMEQGTNNWWNGAFSSNYTSEEIYSYYNIGVSTCDKGAVREFVETFANKKLNIVRNKATGRIESIEAVGDLVGSEYSAASYREYMRALGEGFFFVENTKNTRYEENGVEKAYTTAYGITPDGSKHSFIYTDETGDNIFADGTTNTDPVQAQIIENIISKYEALFTIEKFNSCQETINENKEFVELQKESGNYTDETVNNFNEFLTEASKYFEYYLDKENPVENQDYWRYTKLTGSEYDALLELVNSYKRSLMPVVDSTELQTQIDVKTPLLNDGIFAEAESGEKVQVKTMSSWIAMDNAVNKAKQDKIDTAGNAKYETLEPETIVLDKKEYTYAEPDINTLSADQILVNNDTDVVKAAELKDCDASDRYVSYDAVVDVVSAMERDRYTPEALAEFDKFVDQLSNGTDLTKPSVYVLATDEIAANYNKVTGDNVAAGTKLCATAQDETDPLTTQLLEMLNGLEVNLYTSYLTVQTLDENGDATATITNAKDQKYYGEMFTFDTGADDNAVVTWLIQTFRKGDLDKYMNAVDDEDGNKVYNGEIIKPLAVSRLSSYTGADMLRKADCDMKVTAQINASETAATGVVLKVYNGYNNITDVIYAADIETAKSKLVDPVMPFYNFKEWNIIDQGDNKFVAKPVFDSIPTVTVTVSEGNSLAGKKLNGNIAESGTEVTVSTSNAQFYAWAVKTADNKYQIVSYSKSYTFVAIVDEAYTLITTDGEKYYADGTELTADMVDQFVNTTDNGMTADEYLKLKLDNKAPFIYKQGADLGGRKIFIRVTSGADENDIRAYGLNILNNDDNTAKKYPASKKAVSGQFYMSLSEAAYAKYSAAPYQIQCFVTYSFSYEFNGKVYQINTTDYFNV